jgi:hypothetical protein
MLTTHPTLRRISSRGFRIHVSRWGRRVMLTARRPSDGRTFTASANVAFEHLAVQALDRLVCGRGEWDGPDSCGGPYAPLAPHVGQYAAV